MPYILYNEQPRAIECRRMAQGVDRAGRRWVHSQAENASREAEGGVCMTVALEPSR